MSALQVGVGAELVCSNGCCEGKKHAKTQAGQVTAVGRSQ